MTGLFQFHKLVMTEFLLEEQRHDITKVRKLFFKNSHDLGENITRCYETSIMSINHWVAIKEPTNLVIVPNVECLESLSLELLERRRYSIFRSGFADRCQCHICS